LRGRTRALPRLLFSFAIPASVQLDYPAIVEAAQPPATTTKSSSADLQSRRSGRRVPHARLRLCPPA